MNYKKFKLFEKRSQDTVYSEMSGSFHDDIIPDLVQRLLPEFKLDPTCKMLDIGCGPGVFIKSVKELGYNNVTGVTLSAEDVDACVSQGFTAISASMTDLPIKDASIDFIWCRHALEHSPYPLFTLFEFQRVLAPGGQVFIEVPAPPRPTGSILHTVGLSPHSGIFVLASDVLAETSSADLLFA